MYATFVRSHDENASATSFFFQPEKPLRFTAGQFIELQLPHAHPDARGTKRWFTVSSSPTESLIRITTRFAPRKGSTFKHALRTLEPGDTVAISDPLGDFVLPKLLQTPLVFVAAGIGITPFVSMLDWLAHTHESRPLHLLHAVRTEDDILFQDIVQAAGAHYTAIIENPSPAWGGERGRVSAELIVGLAEHTPETLVYLAGPEAFVDALSTDLVDNGVAPAQIVLDRFPNYPTI